MGGALQEGRRVHEQEDGYSRKSCIRCEVRICTFARMPEMRPEPEKNAYAGQPVGQYVAASFFFLFSNCLWLILGSAAHIAHVNLYR